MNLSHTAYKPERRQRPEAIALLMMTMTLSAPTNATVSTAAVGATRYPNGQFDASSSVNVANVMKLFIIEQRKRYLKQRIFNLVNIRLPDNLLLLPYQTADLLATLDIEPDYILPTEDNGLSIEFRYNDIYHLIEFVPTGEIAFLKKQGKNIDTWDLTAGNYLNTLQSELL